MSGSENEYSLSKTENKVFSSLVKLGNQTKQELILATDLNVEKAEQALTTLLTKGFIQLDEDSGVYYQSLPVENVLALLNDNIIGIETNKKDQAEKFQGYRKSFDETCKKLRETLEIQFEGFKDSSNMLQTTLKEKFDEAEQQRLKRMEEITESMLSSFSTSTTDLQTEFQTSLSSESTNFEKEWLKVLDGFQNIPETGTRTIKGSIIKYEKELSEIIKITVNRILSIQSQLSDVVAAIEAESTNHIQEFFTNSKSFAEDFRTNFNTGLQESWKQEKEFLSEIKKLQITFGEEIAKALQNVVENLAKEIDTEINQAVEEVKNQTNNAITNSSNQIKTEFKEFVETSSELIQEQKTPLEVLNTELTKLSSEKKLTTVSDTFKRQLQAHITADLNTLETNYRRVQKAATDIMEEIRRSAKNRLIKQSKEFEELILSFHTMIEKSIARKDMDVSHFQRLSQSIVQLLGNLLISIPMQSNHFKTLLKNSLNNSVLELKEGMNESSLDPIKDIYSSLTSTQKRIETSFQEIMEENQNEIQKVISSTTQLNNIVSNLQEAYLEKVEYRFEQRAKVMNTELEAIARNFQQVISTMEGGFGDIIERLSTESITSNVESSLQNSITQLKNDVDQIFTQNQKDSAEYITQLDTTLQSHLDRTLDVIKEGFSQIKAEFTIELENQLNQINKNSENQQINLNTIIDSFSGLSVEQFSKFKTDLSNTIEESQKIVANFINESNRMTNEVVDLQQSSIDKYQEKGTNDIFTFIDQIESEVSNQNKKVKGAMEKLGVYYSGYSESTFGEVNNLIRQVQESGDKLSILVNDSLQSATNSLDKLTEDIDLYYTDSLTDLENQIGVTTGFVTSEIENSAKTVREEIEILKSELNEAVKGLSTGIKDVSARQDQEFQVKIPELTQEFSQVFDDLIQARSRSNHELEEKTEESLTQLINSWNKELQKSKTKIKDISDAIDKSIEANLENLEVIVKTNVEQAIHSFSTIFDLEGSKEDIFGLREIHEKVKLANKRLKSAISDSLKSHMDQFDQQMVPELVTSFDAVHTQTEEDLSSYLEDLGDLISSSQTTFTSQLHKYLKEESQNLDFTDMKNEINEMLRKFSQSTSEEIEALSLDLTDSIQMTLKEVEKSREQIQSLFSTLSAIISEQSTKLLDQLTKFKEELSETAENTSSDFRKTLNANLDSYNTDLNKNSLELAGKANQTTQALTEELDNQLSEVLEKSHELFDNLSNTNKQQIQSLQALSTEFSRVKPIDTIRLIKLATDEAKNEFIQDIITTSSKQVTIVTSNPTFLSVADLKAIPSEKRIFIITNFDFTKKGKKWASEVEKQININFYKSKAMKLSGLLAVKDESAVLVLPDTLGFTSTDDKLISYLSGIISLLKGSSLRLMTK
ncbi:MAG: hypothetical protein ACFFB5_00050 [Promethearchaeota archaeon]